jgi:hypothetical protein
LNAHNRGITTKRVKLREEEKKEEERGERGERGVVFVQ